MISAQSVPAPVLSRSIIPSYLRNATLVCSFWLYPIMPTRSGEWQKLSLGKLRMLSRRRSNRSYLLRNETRVKCTNVSKEAEGNPYRPEGFLKSESMFCARDDANGRQFPRSGSAVQRSVHTHFIHCIQAGFLVQLWRAGPAEYDEIEGTAWCWQSKDGAIVKAPLALEAVGRNPTNRGKKKAASVTSWWTAVVARCR